MTSKNDYYSLFFLCREGSGESVHLHRLTRVFVLVLKYHVLAQITIYVPFIRTVNAVLRLHQQPWHILATISALYQCVKKCSQCVVIKFLNKTLAGLPRKRYKVVIVFWMLLHRNMITAVLRHAYSPQFRQLHKKKAPVTAKLQNFVGFAVQTLN